MMHAPATPVRTWLLDWFRKTSPEARELPDEQLLATDYFEAGFIDSLGVITLIEDIETTFAITFAEASFQDRRFSLIATLADIVDELRA